MPYASGLGRAELFTLPKAELHVHVEGTLEPELAFALAERNGIELPFRDVDDLRSRYAFTDLQSFLDLYTACQVVLQTERDFHDLAAAYLDRGVVQGLRHVDLFFDPQAHTTRGVPIEAVIDGLTSALDEAREEYDVTSTLILCILRHEPIDSAFATLASLGDRIGRIAGIGLDSTEVGNPSEQYAGVFDRAAELGLRRVAHAGEEGDPSYVWGALDALGAERIDHGIRSLEDPALVERLVADGIALTLCPLSNVRLRVVPDLAAHPLPRMLELGLGVTINSDDPAYFGGYVGDVWAAVAEQFTLDAVTCAEVARTAVRVSFATDERKAELLEEIDDWQHAVIEAPDDL